MCNVHSNLFCDWAWLSLTRLKATSSSWYCDVCVEYLCVKSNTTKLSSLTSRDEDQTWHTRDLIIVSVGFWFNAYTWLRLLLLRIRMQWFVLCTAGNSTPSGQGWVSGSIMAVSPSPPSHSLSLYALKGLIYVGILLIKLKNSCSPILPMYLLFSISFSPMHKDIGSIDIFYVLLHPY